MHRIDTPTAQKDKFGQGKNGFTNGDPATGRRATDLNSDMWDAVQEEVCTVIEAAGIQLSKGEHTQLHAAIGRLIDEQVKTRLEKNQNGADIPNKPLFLQNVGLGETINLAAGALQKDQNGADIPDKKQFARTIGAVTSTTITLGESGWFKIATVVMPQSTSTVVIKLYGGAGFNVGAFETAAISELVLRSGNGSPVGITATLWKRSPNGVLECAWINTSGDTYDIYINIGQYAYWLIAQYDYTGNANVTLHSTPEYSSVQPGNSTSGQTYTIYSSLMKPTSEDVGALSVNGGQLNGPLSIGTDNALGGNSIVFGDNDTGIKQNGDGVLDIYANSAHVLRFISSLVESMVSLKVNGNAVATGEVQAGNGTSRMAGNGDIFGSVWNGWLSTHLNNNLVADIQLGAGTSVSTWDKAGSWPNTPGYVVTSVWKDANGVNIDGVNYAPLQKRLGTQWYTVQGGTA
ncbi:phage tail protein [Salmonella enterica]|uniref:phage tail protein n=1 Tax=Salmonella enterica TaxID=28901 RepID=UPI0009B0A3CB|nr:phage tail protein [Salmonella enterica]EAR8448879.1 phage tail protein [Salmonella enterica]EBG1273303.1 phage tail protein [Salmonella enterica]EBO3647207.1 phage tail protein [Salmonella enterica]ECD2517878.1 phage tail protein [Salmonella enterica subsp. enterica serovar Javiana]EFS6776341.1 phage tail protein [Salmonella enterica]